MSQNDHQQPDTGNGEDWLFEGTGIGALLSEERKKKGLDYDQIYLLTRLRPSTLEALEKEDWDCLPPPVFVTGYIRSYARALGLEEDRAVEVYQKAAPVETRPSRPLPRHFKGKKSLFILLIFLLVVMVSAYYLWKEYPARERVLQIPGKGSLTGGKISKSGDIRETPPEPVAASLNKNEEGPKVSGAVTGPVPIVISPGDFPSEEEKKPAKGPVSETPEMILKANIRERTWVRIFVDDQPPKEYTFRPDRNPEWRAKEGFELLIGNAGGIDLEFNGEKIENLGDPGQVVRVRLPRNYERRMQD